MISLHHVETQIVLCTSRNGTKMPLSGWSQAQCAALHISFPVPDNTYPGQNERMESDSNFDSTQVAESTIAGKDHSSIRGNFLPSPRQVGHQRLNALCPVCAPWVYINRTSTFRERERPPLHSKSGSVLSRRPG